MTQPAPNFASPAELAELLGAIADRLHAKNRIAMDESHFVWLVAETLRGLGRVFAAHFDDPEVRALFGNAWREGALTRQEQADWLAARLFARP